MSQNRIISVLILTSVLFISNRTVGAITEKIPIGGTIPGLIGNQRNSPHDLTLKVYDQPIGGFPLATEFHDNVPFSQSAFFVELGEFGTLAPLLFDENYWVAVELDNTGERLRVQLLASGFAFRAKFADTAQVAATANFATQAQTATSSATAGIADVAKDLTPEAAAKFALPAGVILNWFGSIATVPAGWAVCDGNNGTPDLRDRFVKGAGGSSAPGSNGGSSTHNHTGSATLSGSLIRLDDNSGGTDFDLPDPRGSIAITTTSADHTPPYKALLYIMKL